MKRQKGFTLIELLVVVAIIALLSAVVFAAVAVARQKARSAQRVAIFDQVRTALENYYDANGQYPSTTGQWRSECPGPGSTWGPYTQDNVIPGLVPTYLARLQSDPIMNKVSNENCFLYNSNGTDYAFLDRLITDIGWSAASNPNLYDPNRPLSSWKIYSSGGANW